MGGWPWSHTGGWPGYREIIMSSPPNDGCPRCLAFGHLGSDQSHTPPTDRALIRINPDHPVTSILDTGPGTSYDSRPCHADWFVTRISAVSTLLPGELELRHHTSRVPKGEAPGAPSILGNGGSHYPAPGPPASAHSSSIGTPKWRVAHPKLLRP